MTFKPNRNILICSIAKEVLTQQTTW